MTNIDWLLLVLTFPTDNATARMRFWRALKAKGCAVLRDGAYLLPSGGGRKRDLEELAAGINDAGGNAQLLLVAHNDDSQKRDFESLFDRSAEYGDFVQGLLQCRKDLGTQLPADVEKLVKRARKDFDAMHAIDFFPSESSVAAQGALQDFIALVDTMLSPGEPHSAEGAIAVLQRRDYQGRTWATRRRMWVDRVASAWLIRKFIDAGAEFLWLESPAKCPKDALGFDFDGAAFTHVGDLVTFEVLVASFELEEVSGLMQLGQMVHSLDVGGVSVPEAIGFEAVMAGARQRGLTDDDLLAEMSAVLDSLLAHYASTMKNK